MSLKDNIAVIIPAAGSGSRFGGSTPKQFLNIGDETVLERSVNLFLEISSIKEVIVAINADEDLIKSQSFYENPRAKLFLEVLQEVNQYLMAWQQLMKL